MSSTVTLASPASVALSAAELSFLLRLSGKTPGWASPLAPFASAPGEASVGAALASRGVLDTSGRLAGPWPDVVATLAAPAYAISLSVHDWEFRHAVEYRVGPVGMVACAPADDGLVVTFPVTTSDILRACGQIFQWAAMPDFANAQLDLSPLELTGVAALADAVRQEALQAFLERRPVQPSTFEVPGIYQLLQFGTDLPDARWLVSLLQGFAPEECRPHRDQALPALQALAARGLLELQGDTVRLAPALVEICWGLGTAVPNAAVAAGAEAGPVSVSLLVRGSGQFWAIEFFARPDGASWARLHALGGPDFQRYVEGIAQGWAQGPGVSPPAPDPFWQGVARPQATVAPPEAVGVHCSACGSVLAPGARFCRKCGARTGLA